MEKKYPERGLKSTKTKEKIKPINNNDVYEVREFKTLLFDNLYATRATIKGGGYYFFNKEHLTQEFKDELEEILSDYIPNNPTAHSLLLTQNTDKRIGDFLNSIGVELINKYEIQELDSKKSEYYIGPDLVITDPLKFAAFLKKIKVFDEEIMHRIEDIIFSTSRFIEKVSKEWDNYHDDIIAFLIDWESANKELERIEVWQKTMFKSLKLLYEALKGGYINEYITLKNLGFTQGISDDSRLNRFLPDGFHKINHNPYLLVNDRNIDILLEEINRISLDIKKIKDEKIRNIVANKFINGLYFLLQNISRSGDGLEEPINTIKNIVENLELV